MPTYMINFSKREESPVLIRIAARMRLEESGIGFDDLGINYEKHHIQFKLRESMADDLKEG